MRLAWLTDVHLDHAHEPTASKFLDDVAGLDVDGILLGGDIAEATDIIPWLDRLGQAWQRPIYLVLGNHDFYRGSIATVREQVALLCKRSRYLRYLTGGPPVPLGEKTCLVGHDGWADARCGDYERSFIMMNDYRLIEELSGITKQQRLPVLRALGNRAADTLRPSLTAALEQFSHVLMLTHVPPLREACWYDGQLSDDDWAPHFTCLAVGQLLLELMARHPGRRLTVLCGHTHGQGIAKPLPNLEIRTGGAEYGQPRVTDILTVS